MLALSLHAFVDAYIECAEPPPRRSEHDTSGAADDKDVPWPLVDAGDVFAHLAVCHTDAIAEVIRAHSEQLERAVKGHQALLKTKGNKKAEMMSE